MTLVLYETVSGYCKLGSSASIAAWLLPQSCVRAAFILAQRRRFAETEAVLASWRRGTASRAKNRPCFRPRDERLSPFDTFVPSFVITPPADQMETNMALLNGANGEGERLLLKFVYKHYFCVFYRFFSSRTRISVSSEPFMCSAKYSSQLIK